MKLKIIYDKLWLLQYKVKHKKYNRGGFVFE